jgi:hypothetical protein
MPGCLPYPATCQLCSTTSLHFPRFHILAPCPGKEWWQEVFAVVPLDTIVGPMDSFAVECLAIVTTMDLILLAWHKVVAALIGGTLYHARVAGGRIERPLSQGKEEEDLGRA